jgi:hypothetical protein
VAALLTVALPSTRLYLHKSTHCAGFGTRPLAKQLRSAEFTRTTCRPSLFRSHTIAHATTTGIGILLTTDMSAGYRKQSVRCGRSIRCDAKQTPSAIHAILLCENNRRSLIILRRRQSTLKPLVCAQRRRACRRSGARGAAGCPGAVDAKRICGCGGY